jgi:hypothetical protein
MAAGRGGSGFSLYYKSGGLGGGGGGVSLRVRSRTRDSKVEDAAKRGSPKIPHA